MLLNQTRFPVTTKYKHVKKRNEQSRPLSSANNHITLYDLQNIKVWWKSMLYTLKTQKDLSDNFHYFSLSAWTLA